MEAIQRDETELIGSESLLQVGDSVIFHARSNFPLSEFHFVLYSHGQIVTSQQIKSSSGSRLVTFDAMATSEMTPSAKGMIWMADRDGRVVSAETTLVVASQDKKAVSSSFQRLWKSPIPQFLPI